ncbi:hypothetical protein HME01_17780 [Vreelandella aquamarina]|nr:hypothetical protein HAALTHF_28730n [Halomonas axialensis]GED45926.1 hypothetical protein HME01_17780 [Halomonas meridiana]
MWEANFIGRFSESAESLNRRGLKPLPQHCQGRVLEQIHPATALLFAQFIPRNIERGDGAGFVEVFAQE